MAQSLLTGFVLLLGAYTLTDLFTGATPQPFALIGFWSGLIALALSESIQQSKSSD